MKKDDIIKAENSKTTEITAEYKPREQTYASLIEHSGRVNKNVKYTSYVLDRDDHGRRIGKTMEGSKDMLVQEVGAKKYVPPFKRAEQTPKQILKPNTIEKFSKKNKEEIMIEEKKVEVKDEPIGIITIKKPLVDIEFERTELIGAWKKPIEKEKLVIPIEKPKEEKKEYVFDIEDYEDVIRNEEQTENPNEIDEQVILRQTLSNVFENKQNDDETLP
jgi:hypothetical protein